MASVHGEDHELEPVFARLDVRRRCWIGILYPSRHDSDYAPST